MKFLCPCGYCFHDNTDNLRFKAHILPDQDMNEFADIIERGEQPHSEQRELYFTLMDLLDRTIYQCPQCGRLFIENNNPRTFAIFTPGADAVPDETVDRNLLMSAHGVDWRGSLNAYWDDPKPAWNPHPGVIFQEINPRSETLWFDDFAEMERQFYLRLEQLKGKDIIAYAMLRYNHERRFFWRRENA